MIRIIDGRNVPAVAGLKTVMQTEWFLSYSPESRPELTSRAAYDMFDSITTKPTDVRKFKWSHFR